MSTKELHQTLKTVKDLILFDTVWKKRYKNKHAKKLPKLALEKITKYRELVRGSLSTVINNIYPNTHEVLKKDWENLLSKYIEKYPPDSPILIKVAKYLPEFLSKQKTILKNYPFIVELANYEWVDVDIYERESNGVSGYRGIGVKLNPVHEICRFNYPIPEIVSLIKSKKKLTKISKKPTTMFIYRDPKDLYTRFFELSPGTEVYIELIKKGYTHDKAVKHLSKIYKIKKENLKAFEKDLKNLAGELQKSRIIIQ